MATFKILRLASTAAAKETDLVALDTAGWVLEHISEEFGSNTSDGTDRSTALRVLVKHSLNAQALPALTST